MMLVEIMGHFVNIARPEPSAPLIEWGQHGVITSIPNAPKKAFGIWQTMGYGISNLIIVLFDPQLLKSNNVMVRVRESIGNGCNAFVTVLGNIFQAPAQIA